MDYKLEVITLPVSDVDQAAAFYTQKAGFALDIDYHPASHFRVVQLSRGQSNGVMPILHLCSSVA
jgi:hypothetical protein